MDLGHASAIITGGASGLGLATARRLHDRGAQVILVDLADSPGARRRSATGPASRPPT